MTNASLNRWRITWAAIACIIFAGCQPRNRFVPPPPPEVTVARPQQEAIAETMEFTGTTRANAEVELRSRVNGYLKEIRFKDGAPVNEGDLLFVIEQAPFEAELQAAQAALQKADAGLLLADANLSRTLKLGEQNATTSQQIDLRKAEKETAAADVATARAALRQAELNLEYTEIVAPMSGRIGRHLVDAGNLVQAEQTPLATIESIDPIYVYFYVSESDLLHFMQLIREHRIPDPTIVPPELRLGLANEQGFPHIGRLDFRELGVDPGTGTILRRATFENPDRMLVPGLFVRLRAEIGEPEPRLLVEERALGADQRGDYVLVVNSENKVEYRPVKLGIQKYGLRVIEEGITADDWVIINGLQRARPNSVVQPDQQEMAAVGPDEDETAVIVDRPAADGSSPVSDDATEAPIPASIESESAESPIRRLIAPLDLPTSGL